MKSCEHIAQSFFAAIESGDLAAVKDLYAPDAVIWHNADGKVQNADENLRVLAWMIKSIPLRTYKVLRRETFAGGFVQQHVLQLENAKGRYEMPACIWAQVQGDHIVRLDEYLDSAHVKDMREALGV